MPALPSLLSVAGIALLPGLGIMASVISVTSASAQATVVGMVVEEGTDIGIPIVDVRLLDESGAIRASTLSDDAGNFRMVVEDAGQYSIAARRVGFVSVQADSIRIAEDDSLDVRIQMGLLAVPLEAVTVVGRRLYEPIYLTQFRERAAANQRSGRGRIYMREDLERLKPYRAEQLLMGVFWGPNCTPDILLDGIPVDGQLTVLGDDVEGVEIYRGPTQIPVEFYRPGMCALAMVWTRSDLPGMKPLTWARTAVAAVILLFIGMVAR